jgi:hypothetical protein
MLIQGALAQGDLVRLSQKATTAWQKKDYQTYLDVTAQILTKSQHPGVMLRRSIALAQQGRASEAQDVLRKLSSLGLTYSIDTVQVFRKVFSVRSLKKLQENFNRNLIYTDRSDTAFVIEDKTLIPEGLASSDKGKFYIGSLSQWKIMLIDSLHPHGEDFTHRGTGLWSVVGIKCFDAANELWACTASEVDSVNGYSGLFCFDLLTGKVKKRFTLKPDASPHFFNDLVITQSGNVYLTDSKAGRVYQYNRKDDSFTQFIDSFVYPNGITIDHQEEKLFIADFTGLSVVDIKTKEKIAIAPGNTYTVGIDGLYYDHGDLIAIQDTGLQDDRVVRFKLNANRIQKAITLQFMRGDFVIPTTGTILNGYFYYIANSHLRNLRPNMEINMEALRQPVILKLKL